MPGLNPVQELTHTHTHTTRADEVNAVVLDIGTYQAKAGYAGEDAPKFSCPTQLGVGGSGSGNASKDAMDIDQRQFKAGIGALETAVDGMEVVSPFKDGVLDDWEAVEALCEHLLTSQMRLNTEEHAVMLGEPSHNTDSAREKMVELMFEKYNVPAVFLAKNAVLSSFAMGKPTSLVVDMGHESTVGACLCLRLRLCLLFVVWSRVGLVRYRGVCVRTHSRDRGCQDRAEGLDQELLDVELELLDLVFHLAALVGRDAARDDGPGDAARAAQSGLGRDKDVRDVLVLGQQGQVKQDLDRLRVGGHDHDLADASVEGLGGLVRPLFDLLVVGRLLDEVHQGVGQLRRGVRWVTRERRVPFRG